MVETFGTAPSFTPTPRGDEMQIRGVDTGAPVPKISDRMGSRRAHKCAKALSGLSIYMASSSIWPCASQTGQSNPK